MKTVRVNASALFTFLSFSIAFPAFAQSDRHPEGFFMTTPMSVSGGYESGIQVGSQILTDNVTILQAPTLSLVETNHRSDFSLNYQPEGELFVDHPELDAWNHSANMRLTHRINSRWSTDTGDAFLSTMDSARSLQNSLLLLPWGRYTQNSFYSSLIERLNVTTKITYRFDNAVTYFSLPGDYARRLDQLSFSGSFNVDHDLTSHQKLSGTFAFLRVDPLHRDVSGTPTNVILMNAGYSIEMTPGLNAHLFAGAVEGSESAFTGGGEIEKKVGGAWFAAGYQRYLGFFQSFQPVEFLPPNVISFGSGLAPASVYQLVSLRSWGQISKHWSLEANVQRALNGVSVDGRQIKSVMAQAQLNYQVNSRVALFGRADYYGENFSPFSPDPLARRRYFGGVQVVLARPPEYEDPHVKHDAGNLDTTGK